MKLTHLRDLVTEAPLASGHAFVSAASGMVVAGERLWVIADDAHCLVQFRLDDPAPGRLIELIPGELPRDAAARKRVKPDFEVLVALDGTAGNRLLALGSGSTAQRMRGAVIDLPASGAAPRVRLVDLGPLFAAIAPLVAQVNVEGAVVEGDALLLFNRGNMQAPASQVVAVPLAAVLDGESPGFTGAATLRAELTLPLLELPGLSGVPLTVTDACRPGNGHYLLSAVAEATASSYADGALAGAAIVELDPQFGLLAVHPLDPPLKAEGIALCPGEGRPRLLCVTDADDPGRPAGLYEGVLGVTG